MAYKLKGNPSHRWYFDYPWEMVALRDWFYMVNAGFLGHQVFLHVRVLVIRSRWVYDTLPDRVVEQRDEAAKQDGAGESPKSLRTED